MNINDIELAPKPESTKHLRVLSNGAIYDTNKHKIVRMKPELAVKPTQITSERSGELQANWRSQKREALMKAANAVAAQGGGVDGRELMGEYAFVEAIGEAMTMKALTVNDPKAVDAARFIFTETGISERQNTDADYEPAQTTVTIMIAQYIQQLVGIPGDTSIRSDNVIDADVQE